jgi:hypothetical protein
VFAGQIVEFSGVGIGLGICACTPQLLQFQNKQTNQGG